MNNIVFVWAWWTGMSWLAMMLFDLGYKNIICINNIQTDLTDHLKAHGLKVIIGHGNYIVDIKDFVIYSDIQAIIDGPEISQSRLYQENPTKKHFHICVTYNQFIAEISKRFSTISITGSNGKTSTTAMAIWSISNTLPNFWLGIVGWLMPNFNHQWYAINSNNNIRSDIYDLFEHIFNQKNQLDYSLIKKYLFIIEACEHREHFLLYDTDYTIITNVQRDHTDYYHTRDSYKEAFFHMIKKTRKKIFITPSAYQTLSEYNLSEIILSDTFSFDTNYLVWNYSFSNASLIEKLLFEFWYNDLFELKNIFSRFQWVWRRMEYIGKIWNNIIYTDYSHHAPAIFGNMQAIKNQFPQKKIFVVFQPHQAQRVLVWREDFEKSLKDADMLLIYKLYTAREDFITLKKEFPRLQPFTNFDELGQQFAKDLNGEYVTNFDVVANTIKNLWNDFIVVIFSAGDLDEKIRKLI